MNGADGETSYASNSQLQKLGITRAKALLIQSISDLYSTKLSRCLRIVDLGCSSGPHTLQVITEIIEVIYKTCDQLNCKTPEFLVFLNDLPSNDLNTIFRTWLTFYGQLKKDFGENFGPISITELPGSFYERLFPSSTIDFFHSSYSLHWLSQVPLAVESNNKGNIYLARTNPPSVLKAYLVQFQKDFSLFLSLRSKEITLGGRMVLTFLGRRSEDPFGKGSFFLDLLSNSLNNLVIEGLIEEAKVDSFNLPLYVPSSKELESIVLAEGSFCLDHLEIFDTNWDPSDGDDNKLMLDTFIRGQKVTKCIRAAYESMLADHFGDSIISTLFSRYMVYVSNHLLKEEGKFVNFVISLREK